MFGTMVDDMKDGSFFPGQFYQLGMQDGAFSVELNDSIDIPADTLEAFEASFADIAAGTFEVEYISGL